jgi:hypothetical protein
MTTGTEASAIVGVVFGGLNFWLLARIIAGMVRAQEVPKWKTAIYFFGKMALLFVTIGLILWKGYVSPLPFLGGFTVSLIVGIAAIILKGKQHA